MTAHDSPHEGAPAQTDLFGSRYAEDFLRRTLGDVVRKPDVALSELVANAWDAGASRVEIMIPDRRGEWLTIEDDGCGLTEELFRARWMVLAYDRRKGQGVDVEFPPGRLGQRQAYGRNGQGRHGLLCFADRYSVDTARDGLQHHFDVTVTVGGEPFLSRLVSTTKANWHGVKLSVIVEENLPLPDRIREQLSERFLFDPGFEVVVNGQTLPVNQLSGFDGEWELVVKDPDSGRQARLKVSVIEGEGSRARHQSGVAFWIDRRLVGTPGWTVMGEPLVDGRTQAGKRLAIIVQSEDLTEDVLPDWTGFCSNSFTALVGETVVEFIRNELRDRFSKRASDSVKAAIAGHSSALKELERGQQVEIVAIADAIAASNPLVPESVLNAAVAGAITVKKGSSLQVLMSRIQQLGGEDVEGLNRLLDEWTVRDALTVLDEVGRRIKVIEAIQKLMADPNVDELRVLHPLVTQARWLFGPEYDSLHYSANRALRNAMRAAFKVDAPASAFANPKKRPDLLVADDRTLSAVSAGSMNTETGMMTTGRILLVELKKGGFRIGRAELDQAGGYIDDLVHSGFLVSPFQIEAFVVGNAIDPKTTPSRTLGQFGRLTAVTFATLVDTANRRLFELRDRVQERYPESAVDVIEALKAENEQLGFVLK